MERSATLVLGGREFTATRARLGGFLRLDLAHRAIREAAGKQDNGSLTDALYAYLCAGLGDDLDRALFETAPWVEVATAFLLVAEVNALPNPDHFSLLRERGGRPVPWDHPMRSAIIWIHLIAYHYGWSRESIEALWPEEAIAFLQEILATEQEEREFATALSDVAWAYDKRTKKRRLQQLPRPNWMVVSRTGGFRGRTTRIPRKLLPQGEIVKLHRGPNGSDK